MPELFLVYTRDFFETRFRQHFGKKVEKRGHVITYVEHQFGNGFALFRAHFFLLFPCFVKIRNGIFGRISEAGQTEDVVRRQFDGSFSGVSAEDMRKCVIAYEPVWAIGTGKVATPDQAEEVHLAIRNMIEKNYGKEVAETVRIQYGGSVNDKNAREILAKPNVDGALVGGASLKVEPFMGIIRSA